MMSEYVVVATSTTTSTRPTTMQLV